MRKKCSILIDQKSRTTCNTQSICSKVRGYQVFQAAQIVNVVQVVRVVQVIKFVNLYDLHGLNNQMIEKT